MHALKNHLALAALHVQDAFVAKHARAIDIDHGAQKILQPTRIKGLVGPEHKALDIIVMVVMVARPGLLVLVRGMVAMLLWPVVMVIMVVTVVMASMAVIVRLVFQKVRVYVELGIEVEAAQVKHLAQGDIAKMHGFLRRSGVHVLEPVHQGVYLGGQHQVSFADKNLVSKAHLAARLLPVIELDSGMLGVDQRQNRVEQIALGNFVVHEKGLGYRARVSQAGGLDHDPVKHQLARALFLGQVAQRAAQVFSNGAADAAIAHLDDLLLGVRHQNVAVYVFLAKLVLNNCNFLPVGLGQHPLEQGGLARTQKAGEYGGGNQCHGNPGWWLVWAAIISGCGCAIKKLNNWGQIPINSAPKQTDQLEFGRAQGLRLARGWAAS